MSQADWHLPAGATRHWGRPHLGQDCWHSYFLGTRVCRRDNYCSPTAGCGTVAVTAVVIWQPEGEGALVLTRRRTSGRRQRVSISKTTVRELRAINTVFLRTVIIPFRLGKNERDRLGDLRSRSHSHAPCFRQQGSQLTVAWAIRLHPHRLRHHSLSLSIPLKEGAGLETLDRGFCHLFIPAVGSV